MDLEGQEDIQVEQQEEESKTEYTTMCTPKTIGCATATTSSLYKRVLHPRSPSIDSENNCASSTIATVDGTASPVQLSSTISTPPSKRFQRIRNPFENALAERMQVPLIGSPSLFQRPATPQHSSTIFEWTIEEVSSLKPANLEPHETQFQDSPDPEYEDKVQSAISSYFKDTQIVPSPVDCPLRKGRIIMSEISGNTPISKPGRRIRDCGMQTELSLPPVLPSELEEALRPYFWPELSIPEDQLYVKNLRSTFGRRNSNSKDVSLRRKLFDMQNITIVDGQDTTANATNYNCEADQENKTSQLPMQHRAIIGKLSVSPNNNGSLSPIMSSDGLSITPLSPRYREDTGNGVYDSAAQDRAMRNQIDLDIAQLSPIQAPAPKISRKRKPPMPLMDMQNYREVMNNTNNTFVELWETANGIDRSQMLEKFTPERSSSPMTNVQMSEFADSSFNSRVGRMRMNASTSFANADEIVQESTVDMIDGEDDAMQVSQLSAQSFSSNSDTPRCKRRSASRKNLSQSFTVNCLSEEDDENNRYSASTNSSSLDQSLTELQEFLCFKDKNYCEKLLIAEAARLKEKAKAAQHGADSGFSMSTSFEAAPRTDDDGANATTVTTTKPT